MKGIWKYVLVGCLVAVGGMFVGELTGVLFSVFVCICVLLSLLAQELLFARLMLHITRNKRKITKQISKF